MLAHRRWAAVIANLVQRSNTRGRTCWPPRYNPVPRLTYQPLRELISTLLCRRPGRLELLTGWLRRSLVPGRMRFSVPPRCGITIARSGSRLSERPRSESRVRRWSVEQQGPSHSQQWPNRARHIQIPTPIVPTSSTAHPLQHPNSVSSH